MTTPSKTRSRGADGTRSPAVRLWQAVSAAHACLADRLDGDAATCSVLGSDTVAILLPLADAPDLRLRMNELAQRSHLTPSGLTRRIDRLEKDALVARQSCPGDRRGAFATLTPSGLDELSRALPHHTQTLEDFVSPWLADEDINRLAESLERLASTTRQD